MRLDINQFTTNTFRRRNKEVFMTGAQGSSLSLSHTYLSFFFNSDFLSILIAIAFPISWNQMSYSCSKEVVKILVLQSWYIESRQNLWLSSAQRRQEGAMGYHPLLLTRVK